MSRYLFQIFLAFLCTMTYMQAYNIRTVAGTRTDARNGERGPATLAEFKFPDGVCVDSEGNLYIADRWNHVLRKVSRSGVITTIAGTGRNGYSGDGGLATLAELSFPTGICIDAANNLYVVDSGNFVIRKISTSGLITTVVSTGTAAYSGDGGLAVQDQLDYPAQLDCPGGICVDSEGNLYIAETSHHVILKVNPSGIITTIAGTGEDGYSGDGGLAIQAQLDCPSGICVDSENNLYIADTFNHVVRRVSTSGIITTIAGTGEDGYSGDGGLAIQAQLDCPEGICIDSEGNLYIAETLHHVIRKVNLSGIITTIAGTGKDGYSGDGGLAIQAQLDCPEGICVDLENNLYIVDTYNYVVRRVSASGIIITIAGIQVDRYSGDGGSAISARLYSPGEVCVDSTNNLYIADTNNDVVRRVSTSGIITTIAGTGEDGYSGDGGLATQAELDYPMGLYVDSEDNLYIADTFNHVVRKVSTSGIITTIAGTGEKGYSGDGGLAIQAQLKHPEGICIDSEDNLYIADTFNHVVRRVSASGIITTVAGTGEFGYGGDGKLATSARLGFPSGVCVDSANNLYIADMGNHVIRKVNQSGVITTIAGTGKEGYIGDGKLAVQAQLNYPGGICVDSKDNLYIADTGNHVIRKVNQSGVITTIAGTGKEGYIADGGLAIQAQLDYPMRLCVDSEDNLYIADTNNNVIRLISE